MFAGSALRGSRFTLRWPAFPWHARLSDSEYVERLRREEQRSRKIRCWLGFFLLVTMIAAVVALQQLFQLVVNLAQLGAPNPAAAVGARQGFALGFVVTGVFAGGMCHLFHLLVHLFPDRQRRLLVKYHDAFHVARRQIEEPATPS